jgi:two-component system nitrogen regulation sensor histidine kinase NtrY
MHTFFRRFRIRLIARILLLSAFMVGFFSFLLPTKYYATILVTALAIIYQVYALIRYVEHTNRDLNRFLLAVKHEDFSSTFSGKELGPSFKELLDTFNDIMEKVRRSRSEKEEHYRYLQTVVQHVGIGLLVFQPDGGVELINKSARRMLKVPRLKNLQSLKNFSPPLVDTLLSLKAGEKALVKIDGEDMELALHAAEFLLKEQKYTLVSLQNIRSELQEKEMEAWQTLIRVLTHEIMNSMTPITSMASTILEMLNSHYNPDLPPQTGKITDIDSETLDDIYGALKTIQKRSIGLSDFVGAYRNLTLIPKPTFKIFAVEELFSRVEKLMESKLREKGIAFQWVVEPQTLELTADPGLIEQVLINLIINAIDALTENTGQEPRIRLTGTMNETGRVMLRVTDNGPGIVKEALEKVFIPFFSTRKKGSGIGLSLSRQIMKLHKGSITVSSHPDVKTEFTLKF